MAGTSKEEVTHTSNAETLLQGVRCPCTSEAEVTHTIKAEVTQTSEAEMLLQGVR